MRYWRDYPQTEQADILATTEKILLTFPSFADIQQNLSASDFADFKARAEDQLKEMFDIPPHFSSRARECLLVTIIISMADEKEWDEPYSEPLIAEIHEVLLKP